MQYVFNDVFIPLFDNNMSLIQAFKHFNLILTAIYQ